MGLSYSEWNEVKLSDIAQYVSDKIETSMINKDNYISTENMLPNKGGVTIATNLPNTKKVNSSLKGDILISNIRPYFKKIWYCDYPCGVSTDVLIIRTKDNRIYNKFLYYFLSQDKFFDFMVGTSKGTKMPRGDKNAIMSYQFKLPPLKEQKLIAKLFELIDEKIKLNNEMNKTLEEIAQSIFKHWFVDFEFPNENGEPYKSNGGKFVESELGMIPEGWYIGKLTDIAELIMGQSPKGDTYNFEGKGLGLINGASDFKDGKITPLKYTTDPKKVSKKGDWIFGVRATVGNVTYVDKEYCLGRGVGVARALSDKVREYLYFQLIEGINYLEKTALGSVYINLSKSDLENMKFVIPSKKIIKRFHETVSPLFNKININTVENNNLILLRDNLLPKLMSGEIRIPEAEEAVESCLQKNN